MKAEDASHLRESVAAYHIACRDKIPLPEKVHLLEKALTNLPASYKLWRHELEVHLQIVRHQGNSEALAEAIAAFEKCLAIPSLHTMPRLWLLYAETLLAARKVTAVRRVYDRALHALPLTQHKMIWQAYTDFAQKPQVPFETAIPILQRFQLYNAKEGSRLLMMALTSKGCHSEAFALCEDPDDKLSYLEKHMVPHSDVVAFFLQDRMRRAIPAQLPGIVLIAAGHYIRAGLLDAARDVFEEGLDRCNTVRSFASIFSAYAAMEEACCEGEIEEGNLARFGYLLTRRDELENAVRLRAAPQRPHLWLERLALVGAEGPTAVERTFIEALGQVTDGQHILWVHFANWYERSGDIDSATDVFERAIETLESNNADDHAYIWCAYAEMFVRLGNPQHAIALLRRPTATNVQNAASVKASSLPVRQRLWQSTRLWNLYVDLTESVGASVEATVGVYERMIQLRVGSAVQYVNYAIFLVEQGKIEEAFTVFSRGVERFPKDTLLWRTYLTYYMKEYGATALEVTRNLFERCLAVVPSEAPTTRAIYRMYASYEQQHVASIGRTCFEVYRRLMALPSSPEEKLQTLSVFLSAVMQFHGPSECRVEFERELARGVKHSEDDKRYISTVCLWFAQLEIHLKDYDRARAVFAHGAACVPPDSDPLGYWQQWKAFEAEHGDVDSHKEMNRLWRKAHPRSGGEGGGEPMGGAVHKKREREDGGGLT